MKRKLMALALAAVLCAFTSVGCSTDSQSGGQQNNNGNLLTPNGGIAAQDSTAQNANSTPASQGTTTIQPGITQPVNTNVNLKQGEWTNIEWENYNNGYFTLTIPKGWQVEANAELDYVTYRAYNPNNEFIGVTFRDRLELYKDQNMAAQNGISLFNSTGTTQEFFERFYAPTTESFTVQYAAIPSDYNSFQYGLGNRTINDYRSLYATFVQGNVQGEGVYSALVVSTPDVYSGGINYGMWSMINIIAQYAPAGQLKNWLPVYSQIIKSFQYTTEYVMAWQQAKGTTWDISSGISDSDSIISSFNERSEQDTILQEKRSDMLGEYERVYDTETGNIYRAYNGFLEDIGTEQKRYTSITDHQYTEGYVGWIEK